MATLAELFQSLGSSVNTMTGNLRNAELENKMAEDKLGVSGTDVRQIPMGVLNALDAMSGNRGQLALDYANQAIPMPEEANKYEAALRFFLEMGKQASQPGSTVLGSAFGAGQVPLDYLTAKNAEIRKAKQARASLGLQIAPSLKPKAVGKGGYTNVIIDGVAQVMTSAEIQAAKKAGKTVSPYEKPTGTGSTYKEQKFYKIGQDAAVIKNPTDAALFQEDGWVTVPPEGWKPPPDSVDAAEVKSSKILDGGVVVSILTDNTVTVRNGLGQLLPEGQDRADAIRIAEERGIEIQGDRSQQRALGGLSSEIVGNSYKDMLKVRTNIATLEDAKRALESGAQTGFFAQFLPDISRSATELANVRGRLGLEVVGSVTFGALSKGELDLALDIGLPENMDEDYLKGWVQERIDAKKKLLVNLQDAASFLSQGNSIGDWMVELEKRETTSQEEITEYAVEISEMSAAEIDAIDLDTAGLSNAELKAYIARAAELESGDN